VPVGMEVRRITPEEMARVSHFPTPSTVLAVGRISRPALPEGGLARGLTLALDGVQDPGNVGTLIRIADWFAFDRVLLSPDCADLFHQKVINASMGSFARVTVHVMELTAALAPVSGNRPSEVIGCDLDGEEHFRLPALKDAVVVIGAEGRGLAATTKPLLTRRVTIPRLGRAESLNAAVAAGIICAQLRRGGN
jgi:TrmH family RNA methyltransferase